MANQLPFPAEAGAAEVDCELAAHLKESTPVLDFNRSYRNPPVQPEVREGTRLVAVLDTDGEPWYTFTPHIEDVTDAGAFEALCNRWACGEVLNVLVHRVPEALVSG